jgi:hypothetical protein
MTWPIVTNNDPGFRPAGQNDHCFYCKQRIGTPHKETCVIVVKTVKVRYTIELEIEVPYFWDQHNIEFHRNEGSWCANNCVQDIEAYIVKLDTSNSCLCCVGDAFKCEYIATVDSTPHYSK